MDLVFEVLSNSRNYKIFDIYFFSSITFMLIIYHLYLFFAVPTGRASQLINWVHNNWYV